MPGPQVVPFEGDAKFPSRVDVVVIGGGIIGTSTALELAERGVSVALCEKGGIAQEQSSRNWGWVRISRRDVREIPLMAESLHIWDGMDARLGRSTGFKRSGIIFTCANEREYADHERWGRNLEGYQLGHKMLSGSALRTLLPGGDLKVTGALYTPMDGRAEPQKAAPAIAEAARERGAHILTQCAVRGVETAGGAVSGVVTERGTIACQSVVMAGGTWTRLLANTLGIDLPQLNVMNSVLRTAPLEGGPDQALWARDFATRKREDGGYNVASGHANIIDIVPASFRYATAYLPAMAQNWRSFSLRFGRRFFEEARTPKTWRLDEVSPFERCRVLDPTPSTKLTDRPFEALKRAFPVFQRASVVQRWAGYMDVTPDAVPVISRVDATPGLHIATGFSGHGFGIGPAAGRLMADIVTNHAPLVDPDAFRLSRFSDGSKIELLSGF